MVHHGGKFLWNISPKWNRFATQTGPKEGNFPPPPLFLPSSLQICWWFATQKIYGVEELETDSTQAQSQRYHIFISLQEKGVERDSSQWSCLDEKGPQSIRPTLKQQTLMPLMSLAGWTRKTEKTESEVMWTDQRGWRRRSLKWCELTKEDEEEGVWNDVNWPKRMK